VTNRFDRMWFADRDEAGRSLAAMLGHYTGAEDLLVLGLPRGGVPVAAAVADSLGAALDVLIVRKLGVPHQSELAMGAIAEVGTTVEVVTNDRIIERLGVGREEFEAVRCRELAELHRRAARYRGGRPAPPVAGRQVILVDDGLATGATMRAAATAVRRGRPARLIAAVAVGARDSCAELAGVVDEVVCALLPVEFRSVHQGYRDFSQISDAEVLTLLSRHRPAERAEHGRSEQCQTQPQRTGTQHETTGDGEQAQHGEPAQ
jgi:putative phosphoribosyl transferase